MTTKKETNQPVHSSLGASSAYRWMECPASVRYLAENPQLKRGSSSFAEEGTAAHELAELFLQISGNAVDFNMHDIKEQYIGGLIGPKKNIPVTKEMIDHVMVYVDAVMEEVNTPNYKEVLIESRVDLSFIHPDMFGTNDAIIVRPFRKLTVFDLKYGAGVAVEVENNAQMMYYALGAAHKFNYNFEEIEMVIVQPRCEHFDGPVRRVTISLKELLDFKQKLIEAVERTKDPEAEFKSGKHCQFCDAKPVCPRLREDACAVAKVDFDPKSSELPTLMDPKIMTMEEIVNVLEAANMISDWAKSVQEYAHQQAEKGIIVPGYKLVAKRAHRKWKDEGEATLALVDVFNLDPDSPEDMAKISTEPKLLSPSQIEKALKADKNLIASLTEVPNTGTNLVKDSNKKAAIEVSRDFEAV